jgi:hypothetical protein
MTAKIEIPPYRLLNDNHELTHVEYVAENELGDFYEVRIRRYFKYESTKEEKIALQHEYFLTNWLYTRMRTHLPHSTPKFHAHKVDAEKSSLPLFRVFSVERFCGEHFLPIVARDMLDNRHLEANRRTYVSYSNVRLSSSAFLWGRKLAKYCIKAAKLQAPDIEDLGPLYYNGQEVLGSLDDKNYVGLEI